MHNSKHSGCCRTRPSLGARHSLVWSLTFACVLGLAMASSAWAQALNTTFETEGNAISGAAPGDDWDSLYYYDSHGLPLSSLNLDLDVYTGVINDFGVNDTTRFGIGTKDIQDIPDWGWQALPPNDKVDITNAQAALYSPGPSTFLYLATDRFDNSGDAAMGLWLLQDSTVNYLPGGTWTGKHVAGIPGDTAVVDPRGDILILAHYTNGGAVDSIAIYEWVGKGGNTDNLFGSQGSDAFDLVTKDATTAFGAVNQDTTKAPWPYMAKGGANPTLKFPRASFFEGALDMGVLFGNDIPCFTQFLFETRESQSLTSALKDFGLGSFSTVPEVTVNSDTVCAGDTAMLCASVISGTGIGPFHYLWSTGDTTQCIKVTTAGTRTVVVTGENGCMSGSTPGTAFVVAKPSLTCSGDLLTCDSTLATASVVVNNSGATGAVTYVWSPAPVSGQGTATARYSSPGQKKVVVSTAAGCKDSCEATITQDIVPPSLTCSGDLLTCDSTLATASVVINNPGDLGATINYVWSPAPVSGQGTATARYNSPGSKKVIVTDAATGCKDSCTATITQDTDKPSLTCSGDLLTCDSTLASAQVAINNPGALGATITYVWSPAPVSGQGTNHARYSSPGTKKVVVTDVETGCKDSCTATITQDIVTPSLSCSGDLLTCDSTLATAHVTINNPGALGATINYVWSPEPVSGQGTADARYDAPGTKKVVVTDVETGCKDSCNAEITQDIAKPNLTCSGDLLTCDSTLASAQVAINNPGALGATITYVWSPAPVSGQGTNHARYNAPGFKKVVVTDVETGCKDSCESEITQDIAKPDLTCSGDLLTCDSTLASAQVAINNPSALGATITYVWSPAPVSGQGTAHARYDAPGTKKVVVTDVETGCKDSCNANITQDITKPDLSCSGDLLTCDSTLASAQVAINNSADLGATITYVWSPEPVSGQGTAHARYDAPGSKKVVVTDVETGCKDSCSSTITQDIIAPNLTCSGDLLTCDSTLASAQVAINNPGDLGGTITYAWSPEPVSGQGTNHARYNTPGFKKVVVTDVETGCKDSCDAEITQDAKVPELICSGDLLTCDSTLASAQVSIENPEDLGSVLTYLWSPAPVSGQGTNHARYDAPGTKKVVVTDTETGCKDSCEATIRQDIDAPELTCSGDLLTCDSLLASAHVSVDNPGDLGSELTYFWSPAPQSGQGTATARYDAPGTKKVVVTDVETGCKDSCNAIITQDIDKPELTCSGDLLTCDSLLASAQVSIDNPGDLGSELTYLWSPEPVSGQGTAHARYDAPGSKKVVVTDVETGCKDSCNANITQDIDKPSLTCSGDLLTCDSTLASAQVSIDNPGDLGATITYVWSPEPVSGQGTNHARYNTPGFKKVVVTDVETGCKDSCDAEITQDAKVPELICSGDLLTCDSTLASAQVNVTNSGDLGSLTYVWSPAPVSGQGTNHARYDAPGTKKVVVTDVETGCKDSCESVITQDIDAPELTCSGDLLTCDSLLATAHVSVDNPGDLGSELTYLWSPAPQSGQGTATARYDAPGTKKVVVTDVETGCKDSCESVITQDIDKPELTCSGDLLTCDSLLASAQVSIDNPGDLGSELTYLWSPEPVSGQGTAHARYDAPGFKRVVVTDVETGCKDSCDANITQDITKPDLSCSGDLLTCDSTLATAQVAINNPGDLGATITYVWSPEPVSGQGTASARYNTPGFKKVVVTDVETGCKDSCDAEITQDANVPDLTCSGDLLTCDSTLASAQVTVNNTGNLGTLSYVWSPEPVSGQGTAHARYDAPGTKQVVVTDVETGCKDSCSATIRQDIDAPELTCSGDLLTCDSLLASAQVSIDNLGDLGSELTYFWSPAPQSGQGTAHARYDAPGTKKVVVTDVETGCKDSCNAIITQDIDKPELTCSGDLLTCDSILASARVSIDNLGELGATITYVWSPEPVSGQGTDHARYDAPGTKTVVVTDVETGCKDSCDAIITQDIIKPDLSCSGDLLTCDSTLATAQVAINNPGDLGATITYVWSPEPVSGQGTASARYNTPGFKKVVVTDAETGCKDSCNAEITQDADVPDLTCSGDLLTCDSTLASASVSIENEGDLGTLIFVWSPEPVSGQGTAHARYDAPGTKKVVVTDQSTGCSDSCNSIITQDIDKPELTCSGDLLTCDSLLASARVSIDNPGDLGGTITYVWSPEPASGQGTAHARYDAPGTKKVVVTDVETGCKDSCESVITQDIDKPELSCSGDLLTCDSLLASAQVSIDNPEDLGSNVTYVWSPAPVSGQGTAHARYDAPGTKKVVVTDVETGCKDSCESVITQDITKPDLSCSGDLLTCDSTLASAQVAVNNPDDLGGTITYVWSPAPVSGQGTAHARYSAPGSKKVVVTDVETGCKDSCSVTIEQDADVPALTCSGDLLTCDSTSASAQVSVSNTENLGTLTYVWSPAPQSGQGTAHARYNSPGTKKVVVTDQSTGCKDSCNAEITQSNTKPDLSCSGDLLTCDSTSASARVTVNNAGSLGTLTYVWSPAPQSGQGTNHARYNTPGTKKVVVTDQATGCKDSCNAEITQSNTKPDLTCSGDVLTCDSTQASARVTVNNAGSLGTLTYVWSPAPQSGQGTNHARYDSPGDKKVVVTNTETGCKDSCVSTITDGRRTVSCRIAPADTAVCPGESVQFCVSGSGGDEPYTFTWTGPLGYSNSGPCVTVKDPGVYHVSVKDVNGCTSTCEATLQNKSCLNLCTFTQGGWGSKCPKGQIGNPKSTQPGCIRDNYFTKIFPNGVTIGDASGYLVRWTTAKAVEDYLPAGGTPKALSASATNPTSTGSGVLGGQILALTLNVRYSCGGVFQDLGMGDASCLGGFVIPQACGKFAGITVDQFLHIANLVLSGDLSAANGYNAKFSDVNFTATCLNEMFDECDPTVSGMSLTSLAQQNLILGDVNYDRKVTTADLVYLTNYLLKQGPAPKPIIAVGNVYWDDQVIDTKDIIFLTDWLLKQQPLSKTVSSGTTGTE